MLRIAVPPDPPPIDPVGPGSYAAPVMWDEREWSSPSPCHLEWAVRTIEEFGVLGRVDVDCRVCGQVWEVMWDPWRPEGRGHAVWIE